MLELDTLNVKALYARAACHNLLQEYAMAIEDYNRALELDKELTDRRKWVRTSRRKHAAVPTGEQPTPAQLRPPADSPYSAAATRPPPGHRDCVAPARGELLSPPQTGRTSGTCTYERPTRARPSGSNVVSCPVRGGPPVPVASLTIASRPSERNASAPGDRHAERG